MDRHWTLDLVALAAMCAGFVLFLTGHTPLAGVVTAAGAYAVLVTELATGGQPSGAADLVAGERDPEGDHCEPAPTAETA